MSSVLQSPSEPVPKILKAQNVAAEELLVSWGYMDTPVLKMQAASLYNQPSTPVLKRSLTRINLPSTLEPVGQTNDRRPDGLTLGPWYRGLSLVWDETVVDTFVWSHYKDTARQADFAATKAEAANVKNTTTSEAITTFNQLKLRPLVCMASPPPFFEWPGKESFWYVWWPQVAPVAPLAPVPRCGQRERCQHVGLCASLIW